MGKFKLSSLSFIRPWLFKNRPIMPSNRCNVTQHQGPIKNATEAPFPGINPENYKYYSSLRIYRNHSWWELLNLVLMTTCCSTNILVDNIQHIYQLSGKVFGNRFTDFTIASTIGRIFTAGDTVHTMSRFIDTWRYPNVNLLIAYSNEIAPGQPALVEELDQSAAIFAETVGIASTKLHGNSGTGIKCSCLCPPPVMKNSSRAQCDLRAIFSAGYGNLTQTYTAQELFQVLSQKKIEFTFSEFQEFLSMFLNKQVTQETMDQVTITKFEWLKDMHMFYVQDGHKNNNKILRQITGLSEEDRVELERFSQRLKLIFDRAVVSRRAILVDAEQSYYQETIDSFAMQYSTIYNKGNAFILNTYQNYLRVTKDKLYFELERCKSLNLAVGAKMVRGAYMVEERNLASKYGFEDPIQPSLEATHEAYNGNLEFLLANWVPGSYVLVASHNEHSVELAKGFFQKYDIGSKKGIVSFGQLLGLGDHITFSLANQGYAVAKYVVFGPVPILIPFFIRRAQETKQMFASTSLQRKLVFDEMAKRMMKRRNLGNM